ncbi:hypothetical protein OC846_005692 [Tilletia horrida]|uniref:Uncharacterized protein n=1 Tax=Tilletia horrida TaxID=155126 RepID=A0AAN6GKV8_9BASI|nr:hypothetical protein OC846_005692 [Tilletia horrida]KAK0560701.1 hypothetical protein OC861_006166 [Tilletia horrida]
MSAAPKFTSQLVGKRVVVIGGTSGIGFGVAQGLIEEGAEVIVSSSSQDRVNDAIARLNDPKQQHNADPSRVSGHAVNLRGPEAEASLKALFQKVGKFDHLIFTAGDAPSKRLLKDHTFESITEAGQVRFVSALLAIKTSVYGEYLKEGGSVVLTTGAVYQYPVPEWTVVAGYAGGLVALVRSLAFELSGHNIRVNGVCPGPVKTEMMAGLPKEVLDGLGDTVLTGRPGLPLETAQSYVSLLKNPNINGTIIHDDGGSYAPKQARTT